MLLDAVVVVLVAVVVVVVVVVASPLCFVVMVRVMLVDEGAIDAKSKMT